MTLASVVSKRNDAAVAGETILIVDDDDSLRELVGGFLRNHGFVVSEAGDVPSMRLALARAAPDLVILDVMMPGEDGLSGLRTMERENRPSVILLSALGSDTDRIVGLEMGADDYVPKPCNPRELLARVRAVLRRGPARDEEWPVLRFAGWVMDSRRWELLDPQGREVVLTSGEFRLLQALASCDGKVIPRDVLAERLGNNNFESFDRAVDIAVSRLRRKLAEYGGGELVRTVRGEGYALAVKLDKAGQD
jgi:two-component system OmpR family response regulator